MSVVPPTLPPVPRVLLRDVALERIRDAIVDGTLAPGQVIKDATLAAELGVGVAPVRSALARLAEDGLVESKPQSHTRVAPLDTSAVRDAVVVLQAMHEVATRDAAPHLTPADLAAMRTANSRFAEAVARADLDAAIAADDALHDVLVTRAGNRAVRATIDRFTPTVRRLERRRFRAAHGSGSVDLHARLIDAFPDADAAVALTTTIWSGLLAELDEPAPQARPDTEERP
jgi:DNA-binding GntR family transcriptional regulator